MERELGNICCRRWQSYVLGMGITMVILLRVILIVKYHPKTSIVFRLSVVYYDVLIRSGSQREQVGNAESFCSSAPISSRSVRCVRGLILNRTIQKRGPLNVVCLSGPNTHFRNAQIYMPLQLDSARPRRTPSTPRNASGSGLSTPCHPSRPKISLNRSGFGEIKQLAPLPPLTLYP